MSRQECRSPRLRFILLALLALSLGGSALAHATLVFGTVTTQPSPPPAGEPFTIRLEMSDPAGTPVEDAIVLVEAAPQEEGVPGTDTEDGPAELSKPVVTSERFEEVEPGAYETEVVLPEDGAWVLVFRDQTFRQEEARASITMRVGEGVQGEPLSFIFPPTATGPQSLTTWLVWLIGLPLVAGAVVTVLVLRGGGSDEDGDDDEGDKKGDEEERVGSSTPGRM